jgi:hypothetical protein
MTATHTYLTPPRLQYDASHLGRSKVIVLILTYTRNDDVDDYCYFFLNYFNYYYYDYCTQVGTTYYPPYYHLQPPHYLLFIINLRFIYQSLIRTTTVLSYY